MPPELTVVIPAKDRPDAVGGAVEAALAQTLRDLEVIVVDDGSEPPLRLPERDRVRVIRRERSGGPSAARNAGLAAARGRYVTFIDDDNRHLPGFAEASLRAIAESDLPPPVGALSGIEIVRGGRVVETRLPPTHPRGDHFSLEQPPPGRSHMTKGTLVVETEVLRSIGGFDESLRSREQADLFYRLNPVCSIVGLSTVAYRVDRDPGERLSRDPAALVEGVERLIEKHRPLMESHPRGYADLLLGHARMSIVAGPRREVLPSIARAFRVAPRHTAGVLLDGRRMVSALAHLNTSG
jgi:glycosyltransferase involved in cell wall biosynthesis